MTARVLVIGLDACEASLVERWAAAGLLPTFAKLARRGTIARLGNPLRTLPGGIWPEIVSGRSSGRLGLFYHPRQIHTGETRPRAVKPEEVEAEDYFWVRASTGGRRVAVIDMPQTVASPQLNGIQLFEWGLHDRNFETASTPPQLLDQLREAHGDHPVRDCDRHGQSEEGYAELLAGLQEGVRRKTAMLLDLIGREPWDLFACTYGETHCVGHQFWHFMDPGHPWHQGDAPAEFRDAILNVYQRIDAGIASLLEAAGPDTTVLVLASHGMGLYTGGPQLLTEFLRRMGCTAGGRSVGGRIAARVRSALPRRAREQLRTLVGSRIAEEARDLTGHSPYELELPGSRAIAVSNNRCGAIRLNLIGREPAGIVQPGAEADELIAELRHELIALTDPQSGEPIVASTATAAEAFGRAHHRDVPDLMIVFRDDLGCIETCRSERVGTISVPIFNESIPRSGDHTTDTRLWAVGPGIAARATLHGGDVLDIAPTVLSLLGLPTDPRAEGTPLCLSEPLPEAVPA